MGSVADPEASATAFDPPAGLVVLGDFPPSVLEHPKALPRRILVRLERVVLALTRAVFVDPGGRVLLEEDGLFVEADLDDGRCVAIGPVQERGAHPNHRFRLADHCPAVEMVRETSSFRSELHVVPLR